MSTVQQSKPSLAKWSIAEESGRPGTCRSNVGCEAIDEPCTNRTVPLVAAGSPRHLLNMNRRALPPSFVVQCSCPLIAGMLISFIEAPVVCMEIVQLAVVAAQ